eukprot:scaffold1180_cov321-Prasinococcus_capsulatus_cf.AAC.3
MLRSCETAAYEERALHRGRSLLLRVLRAAVAGAPARQERDSPRHQAGQLSLLGQVQDVPPQGWACLRRLVAVAGWRPSPVELTASDATFAVSCRSATLDSQSTPSRSNG